MFLHGIKLITIPFFSAARAMSQRGRAPPHHAPSRVRLPAPLAVHSLARTVAICSLARAARDLFAHPPRQPLTFAHPPRQPLAFARPRRCAARPCHDFARPPRQPTLVAALPMPPRTHLLMLPPSQAATRPAASSAAFSCSLGHRPLQLPLLLYHVAQVAASRHHCHCRTIPLVLPRPLWGCKPLYQEAWPIMKTI